ncbi:Fic family protein [Paralysiella testudinis]|uniref:Uncharacterized protein n=1 Tax=Paralysiella testudinis TaxID=2809020 RepID=A0A892ZFR8_9NEIS|nr:hypothetical protein [Paralysiella testudinis]QRQ81410.1 hypothetical protein JQU52_11930 [Paralysiella testudinis]
MRAVSQTGDWNNWCIFFLQAVQWQAVHNLTIAQNIYALYEEMKTVFTETLSSKHSLAVLNFVFTHPVFRNSRLAAFLLGRHAGVNAMLKFAPPYCPAGV